MNLTQLAMHFLCACGPSTSAQNGSLCESGCVSREKNNWGLVMNEREREKESEGGFHATVGTRW